MKTFVFYEFKVVPDNQEPSLFQEEEDQIRSQFATPLDCFVKVLMSGPELHLPTCQPNHKQIPQNEYYRCDQLQHKDGVVLMTMENNKFKTTTVNKKDQKNPAGGKSDGKPDAKTDAPPADNSPAEGQPAAPPAVASKKSNE